MGGACNTHGELRNAYNIFVGTYEGKRPPARPRHRWEYNIRMSIRELEWEVVWWRYLAQDKDHWRTLVNTVIKRRVPYKVGNFLTN
jgi:hypothetical protein